MKKSILLFGLLMAISSIGFSQTNVLTIPGGNWTAPYGISPNGKYVTGPAGTGGCFRFNVDSLVYDTIGGKDAYGVNDDGKVIGTYYDANFQYNNLPYPIAGIWDNIWTTPGPVPGISPVSNNQYSSAYGISRTGLEFSGMVWLNASNTQAFVYKSGTGYELLPDRGMSSKAMVMSGDGKKAGGWMQAQARLPICWMPDTLILNQDVGEVHFMNFDATVVAGVALGNAFIWDSLNGVQNIPLIAGANSADCYGVSDNGIAVGFYNSGSLPPYTRAAFICFQDRVMLNLVDYLNSIGATNVPAELEVSLGISSNGRRIIAYGGFPSMAYVIELDSTLINGIKPVSVTEKFSLSPNPTVDGIITVSGTFESKNATLTISDLSGKLIRTINLSKEDNKFSQVIALSDDRGDLLSGGVYLVSLITEKSRYTQRLVVE